jgi:isopentenyl-diphosphate delta-isomerase type 1
MTEYFDVVDAKDNVIGKAARKECHSNRKLIHRAVAILVFNSKGDILFEKRSMKKDMEPGKWGLVAGHVDLDESYEQAAKREMMEEIGVSCKKMEFVSRFLFRAEEETEMIKVFSCRHEGPFKVDKKESDEVRFFTQIGVKQALKTGSMKITQSDTQILKEFFGIS